MIRVGIDATALLGPRTGVGQFVSEVVSELAGDSAMDISLFALTWRGRQGLLAVAPPGTSVLRRPLPARPLRWLWSHGLRRPAVEDWCGPLDVVHGPNFVVPPARAAAAVVTVHDLTPVRFPELCNRDTLAYPALVRRAFDAGAWIHTPTEQVAAEVHDWLGPSERVVAIPNGVRARPGSAALGRLLAGGDRYVLALGTVEPRKDLPTLVRAFDHLAAELADVRLVVAGPDGWGAEAFSAAIAAAQHRDRIVRLGWVEDAQRAGLLAGASVFAYPSRYEGFGLPPLEAMSAGVAVVTSDAPALVEVTADAALHVPIGDHVALAAALAGVLTDDACRRGLVTAGSERVNHFAWSATATRLAELYRRAADAR